MIIEEYRANVERFIEQECKKGQHRLETVFKKSNGCFAESMVVRWCNVCGAIVVDIDFDNRTNPGAIMGMRSPLITKALG